MAAQRDDRTEFEDGSSATRVAGAIELAGRAGLIIRRQTIVASACNPSIGLVRFTRSGDIGKNWTGISRISAFLFSSSESNRWFARL